MSRITSKNTKPEEVVRKILSNLGFRYRLHASNLPGKPDMANATRKTAIFVNGCFWHQHPNCKRSSTPKSNIDYWKPKLKRNATKQNQDIKILKSMGWKTVVIWECQTKDTSILAKKLAKLL